MKVSIVIPSWNNRKIIKKSLPKVLNAKSNRSNNIAEVIVVDDASNDGTLEFLKNQGKKIKLIRHTKNRGFAAAVNTGARAAGSPLLCFLNVDVYPDKDFLKAATPHFGDKNVFGVSLNEKEESWPKGYFKYGYVQYERGDKTNEVTDTFWVSGGSGVFRRTMWMELKGFDEQLFSPFYWEDIDIGYRAAKRGYKLLWEPKAKVSHKHESVINERNFTKKKIELIKERNELFFNWKNITSGNLFRKHLRGLAKRILRNPGYIKVFLLAVLKIRTVIKKRRIEKKESKVSDESIFARFDQ